MTKQEFYDLAEATMLKYNLTYREACSLLGRRGNRKLQWLRERGLLPKREVASDNKNHQTISPKATIKLTERQKEKLRMRKDCKDIAVSDKSILIYNGVIWYSLGKIEDVLNKLEQPIQLNLF